MIIIFCLDDVVDVLREDIVDNIVKLGMIIGEDILMW